MPTSKTPTHAEALQRAAACRPASPLPCGVITTTGSPTPHAERARELGAEHDAELAGLQVGERAGAHVRADVGDRVLARRDRCRASARRDWRRPPRASPGPATYGAAADDARIRRARCARPPASPASVRNAADLDVRRDRQDAVAQLLLEAVHHRQHDDQRRDAERDAGHRDQRDERDERVAARAVAGARVAQADGEFVRATTACRDCGAVRGSRACAASCVEARQCASRSRGTRAIDSIALVHARSDVRRRAGTCSRAASLDARRGDRRSPTLAPPLAHARRDRACRQPADSRHALLDALDSAGADRRPIAPLAALRRGPRRRHATTGARRSGDARRRPRRRACSPQRVDDLAADEAGALVATLERALRTRRLAFVAARPDALVRRAAARCRRSRRRRSTPTRLAADLSASAAAARTRARWRRWQNEIADAAARAPGERRARGAGRAPVTGIWFWGGGRAADAVAAAARDRLRCARTRRGDLARGIARRAAAASTHAASPTRCRARSTRAIARAAVGACASSSPTRSSERRGCAAFDARWLAPALDALERGGSRRSTLIADGNGVARALDARRRRRSGDACRARACSVTPLRACLRLPRHA